MMLIELADEELARRAAKADFSAFEELVRRYSPPLFKFACGMLNNAEDASDILQQTLLQVYNGLPQRRPEASFKSWAFTIARNKCFDQLRKRRNLTFSQLQYKSQADDEATVLEQLVDDTALPEIMAEQAAIRQALKLAIAALPEADRAIVALRYTSDLSFAEIGQVLGMPEGSVKTRFQRLKLVLRDQLRSWR